MGTEINIVIDNLCNKLGTTVENLIPELARYHIVMDMVGIAMCVAMIIGGSIMLRKAMGTNDCYFEDIFWSIGIVFIVIAAIGVVVLIAFLAGWLASPTAAAVKELIELIGR